MKLLTLLILTLLYLSFEKTTCVSTTMKTNSKKFQSMFELLNSMGKAPAKSNSHTAHGKAGAKKSKKPKKDPFIFVRDFNSLDLIHQGWLKISNAQLKNLNRYPRLTLPNMSRREIATGRHFFRKNLNHDDAPGDEYFWFRLSKRNLWYSDSQDNLSAHDSMSTREFITAKTLVDYARNPNCFVLKDKKHIDWTMCAQTKEARNKWVCKIKEFLQQADYSTCSQMVLADAPSTVVNKVFQPVIMIPYASPMCNENYNFESRGQDWECDCKDGNYSLFNTNN